MTVWPKSKDNNNTVSEHHIYIYIYIYIYAVGKENKCLHKSNITTFWTDKKHTHKQMNKQKTWHAVNERKFVSFFIHAAI